LRRLERMEEGKEHTRRLAEELEILHKKVAELEARLVDAEDRRRSAATGDVEHDRRRLIDIMESTTDLVGTSTPDGSFLYLNKAGRRLLGLSDDADIAQLNARSMHSPGVAQFIVEVGLPKAISDGSFSHETTLLRADGSEIPVSQLILSHKFPTGELEYLSTIIRDTSERSRAETALAQSEEEFRSIIQATPMGIHMYELKPGGDLVFTGANPAADTILGVDNSQFVGLTLEEAFPPMRGTELVDRYREAASAGTPWRTSQVNYEDDQIAGAYEVHVFQTSPGRIAALFLDITDRLKAEAALRESEQRHRALFESMAQGVVYQDADGRITEANPAAERILGLTIDQMTDRTSMDPRWKAVRENGSELPGSEHPAMVSLRTGRPANALMGVDNPRESGRRWIDVWSTPQFREGEPEPFRVFSTFTDITDRLSARRRREELEQQLRQSQKMDAIGQLAGGIAHDFNNLLTTISGYSELVWEDIGEDSQLRSDVGEIRKAAERAAALTQQLLAFSRKQIISPRVLDINKHIDDAHNMLGRLLGETIELKLSIGAGSCRVEADPGQIDQVLINLAVNARDAMPEGGVLELSAGHATLDEQFCRTVPDVEPGEFVAITVRDTGHGMSQETLGRIFEPFFTTKEAGRGTGLGLSTVYGIVKQNRGAVKISSHPGEGTTATIYLPVAVTEAQEYVETPQPDKLGGDETILLVEDEEAVKSLTEKLLTSRGYSVISADDTKHAIQICENQDRHIDLLLTDVVMPQMDGRELYDQLSIIRPRLRVLYMSGYAVDVIARHGVLDRDITFIAKPFSLSTLASRIREVMEREDGS